MPETTTQHQTSAIVHKLPGTNITKALLAVQMSLNPVQKTGKNPHRKSDYATLNDVLEELLPHLHENGLLLMQRTLDVDTTGILKIETIVIHAETGEFLSEITPMEIVEKGAQATGSAITYTRRYALGTFFCMRTSDDDGSAATPGQGQRQDYRTPPQSTQRPAQPSQPSGGYQRRPPHDGSQMDDEGEPYQPRREPIVQPTVVNIPPQTGEAMSDRQRDMLLSLGARETEIVNLTKAEASQMISRLKAGRG